MLDWNCIYIERLCRSKKQLALLWMRAAELDIADLQLNYYRLKLNWMLLKCLLWREHCKQSLNWSELLTKLEIQP